MFVRTGESNPNMNAQTFGFQLGEFRGTVLHDISNPHSAPDLIADPNLDELEKLAEKYQFEIEKIPVDYNNLLFEIDGHLILVDAGVPRPMGHLFQRLEKQGIDPDEVETIVITHTDRDHIGGILDEEGNLSFQNASYFILADSWHYWASAESRAKLTTLNKWSEEKACLAWETLVKIKNQILPVAPGEEFLPGFQLFPALGHRYDHSILKVASSGVTLIHLADALVHPLFMAKSDLYSTYDANPLRAIATKEKIMKMCFTEKALVFGSHFPFPGLGYIRQESDCWEWQPLNH
jgi:glyoxylase-like metal-dependent hydrolase (beta-lactamase superfamily II)